MIRSLTIGTLPFTIVTLQSGRRRAAPIAAALLAIVCAIPALAADLFDDLYARGQKMNAGLKTLTAAFEETSTSSSRSSRKAASTSSGRRACSSATPTPTSAPSSSTATA
jgi:hypothetical protein